VTRRIAVIALAAALAACGGGGGGDGGGPGGGAMPPPQPAITRQDAARFLRQASFGPTPAAIDRVIQLGYGDWIDAELAKPASLHTPYLRSQGATPTQAQRLEAWTRFAVAGEDALRQRVAFALSQILVVSERSALGQYPLALSTYYDLLVAGAFGNYRELIEQVTLNPAMGVYLSMLGNQRPDPARNIRPDENYARELMQLFTIGLVELAPDGSVRRDPQGQPLSTYDQATIEGFAHVFTGWNFAGTLQAGRPTFDFERPMEPIEFLHDRGEKRLLGGAVLPAGQDARADLEAALDNIFAHPNVGPFVSRQLIQRLVASNPSPEYVRRVAARFEDNGRGVRGDLGAVVRAVLLDHEARNPPAGAAGRLEEPLIRVMALWRAFGARSASGRYPLGFIDFLIEQGPLRASSVFNFYRPDYAPPGEMRELGLAAPEMQITHEATTAGLANVLAIWTFVYNSGNANLRPEDVYIDLAAEAALAGEPARLVDAVASKLTGGALSDGLRAELVEMIRLIPANLGTARAAEAVYGIVTAPEYAVLR
jgi:uncharacterized protein (DUF1800 family)